MSPTFSPRLGHYEIKGLLGAGGRGEVYRAQDTRLDRKFALEILLTSSLVLSEIGTSVLPHTSKSPEINRLTVRTTVLSASTFGRDGRERQNLRGWKKTLPNACRVLLNIQSIPYRMICTPAGRIWNVAWGSVINRRPLFSPSSYETLPRM